MVKSSKNSHLLVSSVNNLFLFLHFCRRIDIQIDLFGCECFNVSYIFKSILNIIFCLVPATILEPVTVKPKALGTTLGNNRYTVFSTSLILLLSNPESHPSSCCQSVILCFCSFAFFLKLWNLLNKLPLLFKRISHAWTYFTIFICHVTCLKLCHLILCVVLAVFVVKLIFKHMWISTSYLDR